MDGQKRFQELVSEFLSDARTRASDGLTLEEVGATFVDLLYLGIDAAESLSDVAGPEKKRMVLDSVAALWSILEPYFPVPLSAKFVWVVARYAAKKILLTMASGAIEALLEKVRRARRDLKPEPVVPAPNPAT